MENVTAPIMSNGEYNLRLNLVREYCAQLGEHPPASYAGALALFAECQSGIRELYQDAAAGQALSPELRRYQVVDGDRVVASGYTSQRGQAVAQRIMVSLGEGSVSEAFQTMYRTQHLMPSSARTAMYGAWRRYAALQRQYAAAQTADGAPDSLLEYVRSVTPPLKQRKATSVAWRRHIAIAENRYVAPKATTAAISTVADRREAASPATASTESHRALPEGLRLAINQLRPRERAALLFLYEHGATPGTYTAIGAQARRGGGRRGGLQLVRRALASLSLTIGPDVLAQLRSHYPDLAPTSQ